MVSFTSQSVCKLYEVRGVFAFCMCPMECVHGSIYSLECMSVGFNSTEWANCRIAFTLRRECRAPSTLRSDCNLYTVCINTPEYVGIDTPECVYIPQRRYAYSREAIHTPDWFQHDISTGLPTHAPELVHILRYILWSWHAHPVVPENTPEWVYIL